MLYLRLLGSPEIWFDGILLSELTSKKLLALLFYLATTRHIHLRDELASLFWDEMPDAQARKNLRNILPTLRALLGTHLTITRNSVGFSRSANVLTDVDQFSAIFGVDLYSLELSKIKEYLDLYRGNFLNGFYVSDAPVFEEWMITQRDRLLQLAVRSLGRFAELALQQAAYQQGLVATQHLLELEPWNERAHQLQMLLFAALGERDRALMQYKTCRRVLVNEFSVEPALTTSTMCAQIKAGLVPVHLFRNQFSPATTKLIPQAQHNAQAAQKPSTRAWVDLANLALLYGREQEIQCLYDWIVLEQCRIVMLDGGIGMGKTALARYVIQMLFQAGEPSTDAHATHSSGYTQILWHSCRDMRSPEQLLANWLTQLGVSNQTMNQCEREALLLEQLRQQRCLLVFDHIERLSDPLFASVWMAPCWRFIEGIISSSHQSCLLLIGREMPSFSTYFEAISSAVRSLRLNRLNHEVALHLLEPYGLKGDTVLKGRLIEQYDGVPLFLHLAARKFQDFGYDQLKLYTDAYAPLLDEVQSVLNTEFGALQPLEQTIIIALSTASEPLNVAQMILILFPTPNLPDLLSALQHLQRRSLLITISASFMVPQLMRAYVCTRLKRYQQEQKSLCSLQPS